MNLSSYRPKAKLTLCGILLLLANFVLPLQASVRPLLDTSWGQSDLWQSKTPQQNGLPTYPGCTTISTAQVLYYYQHQNSASADVAYQLEFDDIQGEDVKGRTLAVNLTQFQYLWTEMAINERQSTAKIDNSAEFIYHVGVSLNAQFGGDQGTAATGKQIENAFRYLWGFNAKSRRSMSIISKEAFNYSDEEWAEVIRSELDAGRPVIYNALMQNGDAGHSFVIDGYSDDGKVHVNWGWGGYGNGYFDVNQLQDPSGRRWNRTAMIYLGLEPADGRGAEIKLTREAKANGDTLNDLIWVGNASLISKTSGTLKGYGLTQDEIALPAHQQPVVSFVQWEVDSSDGSRLLVSSAEKKTLSIQYGLWNDRSKDKIYKEVSLPFVLDPTKDGYKNIDGEYFVIAIIDNEKTQQTQTIEIKATSQAASRVSSETAKPLTVGQATWQGNGSIISFASATKTGYGLTQDELVISPAEKAPVLFFQWEIDQSDGNKLKISGPKQMVTITYGAWNDRTKDISRRVELPYTIDPLTDSVTADDGTYLVVKIAFETRPISSNSISAVLVN